MNPENDALQLKKAEDLFIRNCVNDALPVFKELANHGNGRALYFMGEYYKHGWAGLPEDPAAAFPYYRQGVEKGDALCQLNLAYEQEEGSEAQKEMVNKALPKIREMAESGDLIAQHELGDALLTSSGSKKEGLKWERKAADHGYWPAAEALVFLLEDKRERIQYARKFIDLSGNHAGEAVNEIGLIFSSQGDFTDAVEWYRKSAEMGFDAAMINLAEHYRYGDGVPKDEEKAKAWYKRAYDRHGEAAGKGANRIGVLFHIHGDYASAMDWYKKGAETGFDWPMCNIGELYKDGKGVPQDKEKAKEWCKKAYEQHGSAAGKAANDVGLIFASQGDFASAMEWYRKGAKAGYDAAMLNIGLSCQDGEGVPQDEEKAREWCKKAYEQHGRFAGEAANNVGVIFESHGDYASAMEWYGKGAKAGYDWAMFNTGLFYQKGKGVPQDTEEAKVWYKKAYEKHGEAAAKAADKMGLIFTSQHDYAGALEWYKKSAEAGYDWTMVKTGVIYQYGKGVPQDTEEAKAWYKKAYDRHGDAAEKAAELMNKIEE